MNYQFDKELITQHVVKYGLNVQPALSPTEQKTRLQDYCNWLIEQFPQAFETLLSSPAQLRVQKSFILSNDKRAEFPTFILTGRGPVFTLPQRLFIDQVHDINIAPDQVGGLDRIFRKAVDELRSKFAEHKILRMGVINEIVFDTAAIDSVQIVASSLKNDLWRDRAKNLRLLMEMPTEDKNVNIEIRPTHAGSPGRPDDEHGLKFGIIVIVDINNRQVTGDLSKAQINDILTFANDYISEELIRFLNNEYSV